ncbi:MAG: lysozyme inhibitor LprI family protein [Paracoccaceae bacterium]
MNHTLLSPLLALLLSSLPATAQEVDCANAMSQSDMNLCAHDDWQAQDAALNDAYAKAVLMLEEWDANLPQAERGAVQALKEGQRAWITFRDKACEAEGYAMRGGSAEGLLVYGCMARLTEDRAGQLSWMIEAYGSF